MQKSFEEALDFRHACKIFDDNKKISDDDIRYILEAARKAPSSFGQEGWKFLVITNDELKKKLKAVCWNQVQITSCSHLVIVLAAIENLKPSSGIPMKRFSRRDLPKDKIEAYVDLYENHLTNSGVLKDNNSILAWSARQTYIAMANMMMAAAVKGIDSCAIEGFEKDKVEEILALDTNNFQVSCILSLGYRLNEQSEQKRLSFDEVVEFIK